jgi:hypothetical protein
VLAGMTDDQPKRGRPSDYSAQLAMSICGRGPGARLRATEAGYSHTSCAALVVLRLGYNSKRLITAIARRRAYRLDSFALLAHFELVAVEVEHEQSNR